MLRTPREIRKFGFGHTSLWYAKESDPSFSMGLGYAALDRPAYPSGTLGRGGALQGVGASQVR